MSLRTFLTNLRSALPDSVPNKPPITFTRGAELGAGTLRSAALWPDGSRVAIATTRGVAVYVMDRAGGRWNRQWFGRTPGWAVSVSVAGARVVTGTHDGQVTLWNADTGDQIRAWQPGGLCHVALNREASRVAVGKKSGVTLWNADTGERARDLEGTSQEVTAVAFDAQSSRVAAVDYSGQALIWDADTGRELRRWKSPGPLRAVAFSPDGARLAAAGKALTIWDIDMDLQVHSASAPGPMLSVAFAGGGDRLVTGTAKNRALVWDLATGEHRTGALHIDDVHSAGFMPGQDDEIWVASQKLDVYALGPDNAGQGESSPGDAKAAQAGPVMPMPIFARALHIRSSADRIAIADKQVITLWNPGGEPGAVLDGHTHTIKNLWFRDQGNEVISFSPRELISWDAATGVRRWILNAADSVAGAGLSPDGARLAVALERAGTFHLVLCDPDTGEQTREIATQKRRGMGIGELALGPDASALAVRASSRVTIWDVAQGSERFAVDQVANRDGVMQWSPDGAVLALGLAKGDIVLYDARTGSKRHTLAGAAGTATALVFSHDGSLVAGSFKARPADQVFVWNARTGKRVYGPLDGGGNARICQALALRPDSSTLVAGYSDSQDSGTWIAWHLATGEAIEPQAGETRSSDPIWAAAFTADGNTLVAATGDGTATLWTS